MINAIFVNHSIENLERSVKFFTPLGFAFNKQFTAEDSTCMIVGQNIHVMLVEKAKFKGFIDKPIADSGTTEAIISLSCDSKDEVVRIAEAAFAQGARKINDQEDHGFMFSWSFEDLDGHLWDLFWMDPAHVQKED